jgi:hypothetical protein
MHEVARMWLRKEWYADLKVGKGTCWYLMGLSELKRYSGGSVSCLHGGGGNGRRLKLLRTTEGGLGNPGTLWLRTRTVLD